MSTRSPMVKTQPVTAYPTFSWKGKQDPADPSGLATWVWDESGDEKTLSVDLPDFKIAHAIANLISYSYNLGTEDGRQYLINLVDTHFKPFR